MYRVCLAKFALDDKVCVCLVSFNFLFPKFLWTVFLILSSFWDCWGWNIPVRQQHSIPITPALLLG